MPYELKYDGAQKILFVVIKGEFPMNEVSELIVKITRSKEFPPDVPALWDLRLLNMPSADVKYLEKLISVRKLFPERGKTKVAILVSNDFTFGMSRMYEMLSSSLPQEIMVFRDYDKGMRWLHEDKKN